LCEGAPAKYYPHGDILKAGPKAASSFTWQRIVAGLTTFKRGYIYGGSVQARKLTFFVIRGSPRALTVITPRGQIGLRKVDELIDPNTGTWNEGLLRTYFYSIDVNRILQIPLNIHGFDDFVAWNHNRNGQFSVRSAYHLEWKHCFAPRSGNMATLGTSIHNPVWKTLWRLKIPSKIKIFAWRALHGLMPLKSILANRHIGTSGQCPICSQAPEDILHLLFQCQPASALWELLGLDRVIDEAILADWAGSAVLEHILMLQDNMLQGFTFVLKETIVIACWYLWWIRRRRTHNENIQPMAQCTMSVLAIAANLLKLMVVRGFRR
jgi:hypothetical protein